MFYMFIKMSSGWHGKKVSYIKQSYAEEFINSGEMIVYTDDIDEFVEVMGIHKDEITW